MANIYGIVNRLTDTIEYVGQTKGTVASRWNSHKSKGKHSMGVPFDKEMVENGIENYYPIRLIECYESQLDLLERLYILILQPRGNKK